MRSVHFRSLYKFTSEADTVLSWIDEKDQVLKSITIPDAIEDMTLVQHKFEGMSPEVLFVPGKASLLQK